MILLFASLLFRHSRNSWALHSHVWWAFQSFLTSIRLLSSMLVQLRGVPSRVQESFPFTFWNSWVGSSTRRSLRFTTHELLSYARGLSFNRRRISRWIEVDLPSISIGGVNRVLHLSRNLNSTRNYASLVRLSHSQCSLTALRIDASLHRASHALPWAFSHNSQRFLRAYLPIHTFPYAVSRFSTTNRNRPILKI